MARGCQKAEWDRTSLLAAIGANPNRDPKKRQKPYEPWEFNPFRKGPPPKPERTKIKIKVECLKGLCEKGQG
jgi:hypothetical protein